MEEKLIELLEEFAFPVIRQGSLTESDEYPPTFFTFWNNEESEAAAYDNQTYSTIYSFDVNIYSNNPDNVYRYLREARKLLKNNGWQTPDGGHDIASDEETHIGRGITVTYINLEN